ncbi:hypothetical protein Tco_0223713 [Tanacetum coccineum]
MHLHGIKEALVLETHDCFDLAVNTRQGIIGTGWEDIPALTHSATSLVTALLFSGEKVLLFWQNGSKDGFTLRECSMIFSRAPRSCKKVPKRRPLCDLFGAS